MLPEGLPQRPARTTFDFQTWADGQAWRFDKGTDYDSSTETFRGNVRRWAKQHGYEVEIRPIPAVDKDGNELPLAKTDAVGLAIQFLVRPR